MTYRALAVLCASLGVWALGCSSDDSSSSETTLTRDQYATAFAEAYCGKLESCCPAAGLDFNRTTCLDSIQSETTSDVQKSAGFDGAAASRCVELMKGGNCNVDDELEKACGAVTRTQAVGQACNSDKDCIVLPGSDESPCKQGVCTSGITSRGTQGQACRHICHTEGDHTHCIHVGAAAGKEPDPTADGVACYLEDGLTCDPETFVCVARAAEGTTCPQMSLASWGFCADGLTCAGNGVCTKAGELGQPCVGGSMTEACVSGAECDTGTNTCVKASSPDEGIATEYTCAGQ